VTKGALVCCIEARGQLDRSFPDKAVGTTACEHASMDSRVVALTDIDAPFIDRWRVLAKRPDITPSPFVDVDFLRPAAEYLPEAKGMRLLVGEDHGDLVWLMPLIRTSRMGGVPVLPGLRNIFDHNWPVRLRL
jgi:hypothetical protein